MKKIFLLAVTSFLILMSACNNEAGNASNTDNTDSNDAVMETGNSNMSSNNVMSKMGIPLSPSQEVPANNSTASGTADVTYNKESHMLAYKVNWSGLTGAATMAHIHGTAPKGVNAGVKKDLSPVLAKSMSGSFSDSVMIDGSAIKEDSLLSGMYYFNIHTAKYPGGEIRGQIEF